MRQPLLCMFLGYPGSGKSYFAKHLAAKIKAVRLNADSMRIALYESVKGIELVGDTALVNRQTFGALDYAVGQILAVGYSVIYDAHQNKRSIRADLERLAARHNAIPIVVWINTPYDIALKRGQERQSAADQRQFSEDKMKETMARHMAKFDEPIDSENVIMIDGTLDFERQYASFLQQLTDLSLD